MALILPFLAVLAAALAVASGIAYANHRAAPGSTTASVSGLLLDRRTHVLFALGLLVVVLAVTAG